MNHGAYTGKLGYQLYEQYIDTIHKVYYDHNKKNQDEPNCSRPTPFFNECSNETKLSHVDIAVVNERRNSIELIVEVEESGAEPKKIIGDITSIILSDKIRIKGKDYNYGDLTFILGVKTNPKGKSKEKIETICQNLIKINEIIGNKKIDLILIFDNNLKILFNEINNKVKGKIPIS